MIEKMKLINFIFPTFAVAVQILLITGVSSEPDRTSIRYYLTNKGECTNCSFHGRDYQWCKTGPDAHNWAYCSTKEGFTTRNTKCREDHKCEWDHKKKYYWCEVEDGKGDGAWDFCSTIVDMGAEKITETGEVCQSRCKQKEFQYLCRDKSSNYVYCLPNKVKCANVSYILQEMFGCDAAKEKKEALGVGSVIGDLVDLTLKTEL